MTYINITLRYFFFPRLLTRAAIIYSDYLLAIYISLIAAIWCMLTLLPYNLIL